MIEERIKKAESLPDEELDKHLIEYLKLSVSDMENCTWKFIADVTDLSYGNLISESAVQRFLDYLEKLYEENKFDEILKVSIAFGKLVFIRVEKRKRREISGDSHKMSF